MTIVDTAGACPGPRRFRAARAARDHCAPTESVLEQATEFLESCAGEAGRGVDQRRLRQIALEIGERGTYTQTTDELAAGARLAWRNHTRCIGKLYWRRLDVRDCRGLETPREVFDAAVQHLRSAYNNGAIRPVLTAFAPHAHDAAQIRIWNAQLVSFAGYRQRDGSIVGDPSTVDLTTAVRELGWAGSGGPFDVLPLVIETPGHGPELFELPSDVVVTVPLSHPEYPDFETLGLRWYAFPTVSNLRLEIGGVSYSAAPFSGWYVSTEIAARNLADSERYNLLPTMARVLGLDTSTDRTMWKDRALVELSIAVLSSYESAGIRMMDHHTMAKHFAQYVDAERRRGRDVSAEWTWMVPPMSPATTAVYRQQYDSTIRRPNFFRSGCPRREN